MSRTLTRAIKPLSFLSIANCFIANLDVLYDSLKVLFISQLRRNNTGFSFLAVLLIFQNAPIINSQNINSKDSWVFPFLLQIKYSCSHKYLTPWYFSTRCVIFWERRGSLTPSKHSLPLPTPSKLERKEVYMA
jgi:hypothetical protein